jgi:cation diffusion facilitator CzcD-associated flavoprotein CzcO
LRDEIVRYLEQYASFFQLPILPGIQVIKVNQDAGGFQVVTANGQRFFTRALIVTSGAFSRPYTPEVPGLESFQGVRLHSTEYRNVEMLSGQRIVVIGAANSAVQIAYELAKVAEVTLATREAIRFFPQKLLGADFRLGPEASPNTVAIILAGCAVLSVTIFCGYAIVFSTAPMIRGYRRARRWIEGTLALVFGAAGIRLLFSRS